MKKNLLHFFLTIILCLFFLLAFPVKLSFGISESECNSNWKDHIEECINLWEGLRNQEGQKVTSLKTELIKIDTSIAITTARILQGTQQIEKLEGEIDALMVKIGRLDISLDQLSEILAERIAETYKKGKIDFLGLFLSSQNFSDFISRYKYLRVVQLHDRSLMIQMETARTSFEDQKTLKEEKQKELDAAKKKNESLKVILAQQKKGKEFLLKETQNSEKRYQQLINQAIAEQAAIIGILAGEGKELKVGNVSEGQSIASIFQGKSCNSSGTHLHFMVVQDNNVQNPFSYLNGGVNSNNCSGSGCGSGDGDTFNPSGSWNWPIVSPITLHQGYGNTWAVQHTWVREIYNFHNGIDVNSSSSEVRAVKSGELYRGIYTGKSGCLLQYVRVHHDEGNFDTYYLHVNY